MKKLKNIYLGEILKEEFLDEIKISAYKLAKDLKISQTRISEIVKGKKKNFC
jgi:antitoxin HigA-1